MGLYPDARAAVAASADDVPVHDPRFDVAAARAEGRAQAAQEPREDVAEVADVDLGGVPCRRYRPAGARPGTVVHLHGGGFVLNDVEVHDAAARRLADRAGRAVVSVDYRLAPEHPYPAAVHDVDAVVAALGSGEPVVLHGDSAGANLALGAALRHPGRFVGLALTYPFLDPAAAGASHRTETDGLGAAEVAWYWRQYAGDAPDLADPDLAPLAATDEALAGLPTTLVATAEHDPARDEGELLAARLAEAGVRVSATRWLGQPHGFWRHPRAYAASAPLTGLLAAFLDDALAGAPVSLEPGAQPS
ncbi:alpha/beta hydrolase fold domain-containing protein [Nocardioides litoris]|uniref:alpha/beta hydrolase fold domain-containing protein n=1 Tax=Nocardioides litoris TaxID=1926648 RepID=UPI00111E7523|nr:alpha/beta hydrolase fold domain-containing protein [Nocardioides litoris]